MTWLRTTGLAIVSASFFHRCSPVSILAPAATHSWKRLTRLHEEHIIAQSKTASAPPAPQFPWSYSVSLQFSALGICLFSLSEATAQNNHQKTITTVCLCQSCPTSQGVSALAQVELIWWPLFKANGVYIFYWKNFVVGNIFPHFYFLFQLLEKLAFFVFTSSRCSHGTIQNNHWEFQEGFGDKAV